MDEKEEAVDVKAIILQQLVGVACFDDLGDALKEIAQNYALAIVAFDGGDYDGLSNALTEIIQQAHIATQATFYVRGASAVVGRADVQVKQVHADDCENPDCPIHSVPRDEEKVH